MYITTQESSIKKIKNDLKQKKRKELWKKDTKKFIFLLEFFCEKTFPT